MLQLTNSGTVLGIVTALQFGPALLLSIYGGALADRGDKRRLLLADPDRHGAGRPGARACST